MKTLPVRRGARLNIRAVAYPGEEGSRDKCATLAFLSEQSVERPDDWKELDAVLTLTVERGAPPRNELKFRKLIGTDDLYEFKTYGGLRLVCFWDDGSLIVCTHGFVKKQQKTPKHEIARASQMKKDYELAKQKGELIHVQ